MTYLLQRLLTEAAARQPQRPAVASGGCLLTYQELDRLSNKVARSLVRLGVAPGDRVAILAPKSAAAVIGIYGALKAGACYVPLDPKAPAGRLSHIVRDSGAAVIVADEARTSQAATLAGAVPRPRGVVVVASVPGRPEREEAAVAPAQGAAIVPWAAVAGEPGEPFAEERAIETDLAYILYTSGSTGTPKGVMISHRNSLTFVDWAAAAAGLSEQDRVLQPRAAALRPVGLRHLRHLPGRRLPDGASRTEQPPSRYRSRGGWKPSGSRSGTPCPRSSRCSPATAACSSSTCRACGR